MSVLRRALVHHTPEIHHSDQGVQYTALAYVQMLQLVNAPASMAEAGAAWHAKHGYAERLIRIIKEEKVDLSDYHDYSDARRQLGRLLDAVYIHKRIHSSLGYLTPAKYEDEWRRERTLRALDVH